MAEIRAGRDLKVEGETLVAPAVLAEFYEKRGYRRVWDERQRKRELVALVEDSVSHGLDPGDYHAEVLARTLKRFRWGAQRAADDDLLLTDALVRLVEDLHSGKTNPSRLYPEWGLRASAGLSDPSAALESVLASGRLQEAVERYAPPLEAYQNLRWALRRYLAIEQAGGWPIIPAGPTLKQGMRDARVKLLRTRLAVTGDYQTGALPDEELFDEPLAAAVKDFQRRNGLEADGSIGRRTRGALNVGVADRIDQIRANLERLRWVAQELNGDYLLVDIAGFTARLHMDGRTVWTSRVVVGLPYRKTPVFRSTLKHVVVNPSWVVPPTILREDLVPKLIEDPYYTERNGMTIIDDAGDIVDPRSVDWPHYVEQPFPFPFRIVQTPGDYNPLGRYKFLFPNPHVVYLHDTPAKELFDRSRRAFSSGCIRIENPRGLAELIIEQPASALDALVAAGDTVTLPVKRQVTVLLLYFTAEADRTGRVVFHPDLYRLDPPIVAALPGRPGFDGQYRSNGSRPTARNRISNEAIP